MASALGGRAGLRLAKQMSAHGKGPVPWGGVAVPLDTAAAAEPPTAAADGSRADAREAAPQLQGRAFCFLPLPLHSGLPVHVNGLFEVTNNRRAASCCAVSTSGPDELRTRDLSKQLQLRLAVPTRTLASLAS